MGHAIYMMRKEPIFSKKKTERKAPFENCEHVWLELEPGIVECAKCGLRGVDHEAKLIDAAPTHKLTEDEEKGLAYYLNM